MVDEGDLLRRAAPTCPAVTRGSSPHRLSRLGSLGRVPGVSHAVGGRDAARTLGKWRLLIRLKGFLKWRPRMAPVLAGRPGRGRQGRARQAALGLVLGLVKRVLSATASLSPALMSHRHAPATSPPPGRRKADTSRPARAQQGQGHRRDTKAIATHQGRRPCFREETRRACGWRPCACAACQRAPGAALERMRTRARTQHTHARPHPGRGLSAGLGDTLALCKRRDFPGTSSSVQRSGGRASPRGQN